MGEKDLNSSKNHVHLSLGLGCNETGMKQSMEFLITSKNSLQPDLTHFVLLVSVNVFRLIH